MLEKSLEVQKSYPVKNHTPEEQDHFEFQKSVLDIFDEVIMALLYPFFPPMHFRTNK